MWQYKHNLNIHLKIFFITVLFYYQIKILLLFVISDKSLIKTYILVLENVLYISAN